MNLNKNYYEKLNITKNSNIDDIKKNFRELSKKYHPDRGGDEEKFKEISEAYSIIGDKKRKSEYDTKSKYGNNYNPRFEFGGFESMFNGFNTGRSSSFEFNMGGNNQYTEELNININVDVENIKIYNNESIEIEFIRNVPCSYCDGKGVEESEESDICLSCNGQGKQRTIIGDMICNYCQGEGRIHIKECSTCNGNKIKHKKERITVDNISLLRNGSQTVTYGGFGHFSKYYRGRTGNVNITLNTNFGDIKVEGCNIHREIDIDFLKVIKGGIEEIEHLDGKKYKIKIPEKSNNNTKFKLSGKGFYQNDKVTRGDLIFNVNIIIDYNNLTEEKINLLSKI